MTQRKYRNRWLLLIAMVVSLSGLTPASAVSTTIQGGKETSVYIVRDVFDAQTRSVIAATGALILEVGHDYVLVEATPKEMRAIGRFGLSISEPTAGRGRHFGLSARRLGLSRLRRDGRRAPAGRVRSSGDLLAVQHRHVVRGAHDLGGQDLGQRGRGRGRARGAVHPSSARPRASDGRDGALHAEDADRRIRHRSADHRSGGRPRDLDRLRHESGRRRVRHRDRQLRLVAQEPPAQRRLAGRHRPESQLGLQLGLLRRQQRHDEQRDLSRSGRVLGPGDRGGARLREQPRDRRQAADHGRHRLPHLRRAGHVALRLYLHRRARRHDPGRPRRVGGHGPGHGRRPTATRRSRRATCTSPTARSTTGYTAPTASSPTPSRCIR